MASINAVFKSMGLFIAGNILARTFEDKTIAFFIVSTYFSSPRSMLVSANTLATSLKFKSSKL